MTGKEALEKIKYCRAYIKADGCEISICEVREYKIIKKELELLSKYKRAFEILKDKGVEVFYRCNGYDPENTKEYWFGGNRLDFPLTKEEYELLKELMKDD